MQNTKHYFDYERTLVDIKPLLIKTCQNVVKTAMPKNSQMFTGSWEGTVKGQKLMPKICPVKVGTWPATWYLIFMFMVTYFATQSTRP